MTPYRPFGKTGLFFFPFGLGTIWFGRKWPPDNSTYTFPATDEINKHLLLAYQIMRSQKGLVMIDTAAAYGNGERIIGDFFSRCPDMLPKTFLATKWGEDFDIHTNKSHVDHSLSNLHHSFKRSLKHLQNIDLLYLHKTDVAVLRDHSILSEMLCIKNNRVGGVQWIGVSISDEVVLDVSIQEKRLEFFDVIQMPAQLFLKRPDLIQTIFKEGKAIVLNSPVRKSGCQDPKLSYLHLLKNQEVSMILTGTRTHLLETVGYVNSK